MNQIVTLGLFVLLLAGCAADEPTVDSATAVSESERLNGWLDAEFKEYLEFSPMSKTRLGDKSDYDQLDDVSDAMADKRLAWRRESVSSMKASFSREALDAEAKRSYDLWVLLLERAEKQRPFRRHEYVFGRRGPHTRLPNSLINYQDVETIADMQAYISRLEQSGRYLGQYLARAQMAATAGVRAPYFDYDVAMSQIERVTRGKPFSDEGDSALWQDVMKKINGLIDAGSATPDEAEKLRLEAEQAILGNMAPAYAEITAWLKADRANVSEQAEGAWSLPDGERFYAQRLELMTTLPLTAEEIHQTGLREVARIQSEMNEIRQEVGFAGDLRAFFNHLRDSDQFYFDNTDEGREAYLDRAREHLAIMQRRLPDFFGILPKGPLEVRRVEAFREQPGAAAHYMRGTKDGSRPGVFYVHLADMRAVSKYRMENLAYHEGVPGHHMQIAIQQELEGIPQFRTYHGYTAFSEGWGLYSEFLGKEMGGYEDPYSDFGRLTGEIWRAIRLVVDTGIHAKRWTEAQAIEYALANSPRPEATVKSEIRRYFNMPAQATAYKIGMLEIQRIRSEAEQELGDQFNIKEFHDVLLGSGPLPMSLLAEKVDAWVSDGGGE